MKNGHRNDDDLFIYEREIRPWLPRRIFDAHSHLLNATDHADDQAAADSFFYQVDMKDLQAWWRLLFPNAKVNGLVMGMPVYNCDLDAENRFVAESVVDAEDRFSLMTRPEMAPEKLKNEIEKYNPAGLKPYLTFATVADKQQARITDFISEEQLQLANDFGLAVTLHVSKPRGMADPENLQDISRLIRQYPKCQFILAHCGRCFIVPNMADALDGLPTAENLWIDTSAVCETDVFLELFSRYDLSHILFGTDLVNAAAFRGRYVQLGLSWHVVTPDMVTRQGGLSARATFAVYENVRALLRAARFCQIGEDNIQNIFYGNAARLFKLTST